MKHPNMIAAAISYAAAAGAQYLVARYAHQQLSEYWKQAVDAGTASFVLYIGRAGVKAALLRLWDGTQKVWQGSSPPSAPAA